MNFDFVSDYRFKELLEKDYQELTVCLQNKTAKAVLILSGSIIEASLVEYFLQNPPTDMTEQELLKSSIGDLIRLAEVEGLLTLKEKNLAAVVQDYRNLIHPGRQVRKNEKYTFDNAQIANNLVNIIIDAIKHKHTDNANFTAEEIINKLKDDWNFRSIYGEIILKLNQNERKKLLGRLIAFEMEHVEDLDVFLPEGVFQHNIAPTFHNLYNIKPLVNELKPLIQSEGIFEKLTDLTRQIQRGSKHRAFAIFNLFHEDIDKLPLADQELIAVYFLSFYSSIVEYTKGLTGDKTYSTIGRYIYTEKGLKAFCEFTSFCINNFSPDSITIQMDFYEQAFNSLSEDNKKKTKQHIISILNDKNAGFSYVGFVNGAITKKIVSKDEIDYSRFTRVGRGE